MARDKFPHFMTTVVVYEPHDSFQDHATTFNIAKFTHEQRNTKDPCKKKLTQNWNIAVNINEPYNRNKADYSCTTYEGKVWGIIKYYAKFERLQTGSGPWRGPLIQDQDDAKVILDYLRDPPKTQDTNSNSKLLHLSKFAVIRGSKDDFALRCQDCANCINGEFYIIAV